MSEISTLHLAIEGLFVIVMAIGGLYIRGLSTSIGDLWESHNKRGDKLTEIEVRLATSTATANQAKVDAALNRDHVDSRFNEVMGVLNPMRETLVKLQVAAGPERRSVGA